MTVDLDRGRFGAIKVLLARLRLVVRQGTHRPCSHRQRRQRKVRQARSSYQQLQGSGARLFFRRLRLFQFFHPFVRPSIPQTSSSFTLPQTNTVLHSTLSQIVCRLFAYHNGCHRSS